MKQTRSIESISITNDPFFPDIALERTIMSATSQFPKQNVHYSIGNGKRNNSEIENKAYYGPCRVRNQTYN
jgi:hypothetical protein